MKRKGMVYRGKGTVYRVNILKSNQKLGSLLTSPSIWIKGTDCIANALIKALRQIESGSFTDIVRMTAVARYGRGIWIAPAQFHTFLSLLLFRFDVVYLPLS